MNVTLPCALFSNANGITINGAMIVLILMGIILNNAKKKITIYTSKGIDENNFFITVLGVNF